MTKAALTLHLMDIFQRRVITILSRRTFTPIVGSAVNSKGLPYNGCLAKRVIAEGKGN
jgi:hypothetical protein